MQTLTIIIADDHPLFRGALSQAVQGIAERQVIIEAGDFEAARQAAAENPDADLMLLDLAMPGVSGFSGLMSLRAEFSSLPIVIVSASDDGSTIRRALELGASGFISKSSGLDDIRAGIQAVLEGDIWAPKCDLSVSEEDAGLTEIIDRLKTLTPQQSRVLTMLGEGLLNKQIAYELGVSEATIKAHVSAILLKLNVDSRTQAVIKLGKINMALVA
ncbi:response regulator transcription factor [Rhizobium sp. LC145]|jgi:DNA-binding NarL/FixJ family response regulator|uniref:response regulator n=1 Tax=Rhizobium sp. LC145 TaxID=1120688 RepID=UPI00062A0D32|nr:response regulator transcription factor [Rhizobium sp. LC145]KKX31904.1 LuxR family transcriptional regulator [Rhizobium sp. LC145]TKT56183.1 response regulator transcription factor [Rhizobiaceae bacterium LC148]